MLVSTAVRPLQEAVEARLEGATDLRVGSLADRIHSAYRDLDVPEQLGLAVKDAANAYEQHHNQHGKNEPTDEATVVVEHALVAEVLTRAFAAPWVSTPPPPFTFARIGPDTPSPVAELKVYERLGDQSCTAPASCTSGHSPTNEPAPTTGRGADLIPPPIWCP
jgi:hypothetical protein